MTDPAIRPNVLRLIYDATGAEPITQKSFDVRVRILPRTATVSAYMTIDGPRARIGIEGRALRLTDDRPGRNIGSVAYWSGDEARDDDAITAAPQWAQDLYADALRRIKAALA